MVTYSPFMLALNFVPSSCCSFILVNCSNCPRLKMKLLDHRQHLSQSRSRFTLFSCTQDFHSVAQILAHADRNCFIGELLKLGYELQHANQISPTSKSPSGPNLLIQGKNLAFRTWLPYLSVQLSVAIWLTPWAEWEVTEIGSWNSTPSGLSEPT